MKAVTQGFEASSPTILHLLRTDTELSVDPRGHADSPITIIQQLETTFEVVRTVLKIVDNGHSSSRFQLECQNNASLLPVSLLGIMHRKLIFVSIDIQCW
jgi:hypothetical protein